MRILIVESDAPTAASVEEMLQSEGFKTYVTHEGTEGLDLAKIYDYDLITLALDLPDMSGYDVLKALRVAKCKTPILVLSGRVGTLASVEAIVKALGMGADDFMTLPFHKEELVARIHAIARRSKGHAVSAVTVGPLCVSLDSRTASVGGQPARLTRKEYDMLELLALRKGMCITKEMFLNHLYGGMDEPEIKIIDVFICKLRKKLPEGLIATVWGRGYVLRDPSVPGLESPSLAPELRDLMSDSPAHINPNQRQAEAIALENSPPLAPITERE